MPSELEPRCSKAILVGGGTSAEDVSLHLLRQRQLDGWTIFGVNESSVKIPFCDVAVSIDRNWIVNRTDYLRSFEGHVFLSPPDDVPQDIEGARYLRRYRGKKLSDRPDMVSLGGGNSGFAALNVAVLMGAKHIVLVGYDFRRAPDGKLHWFDEYPWSTPHDLWSRWAKRFQDVAPSLKQQHVEVVNTSSFSLIDAFPKVSLASVGLSKGESG